MESGKLHLTLNGSCIRYLNTLLKDIHEGSDQDAQSDSSFGTSLTPTFCKAVQSGSKKTFDEELLELYDGITNLMCLKVTLLLVDRVFRCE